MRKDEFYYHAIRTTQDKAVTILDSILKDGIKSVESGHLESNELGRMNFSDEICICKESNQSGINFIKNLYIRNSALDDFIYSGMLILRLDGNIKGVYKPEVLSSSTAYKRALAGERGFTEYHDEYRTKEDIDASCINGILFPAKLLLSSPVIYMYSTTGTYDRYNPIRKPERVIGTVCCFEAIQEVLKKNNRTIPIYDSTSKEIITSVDDFVKKHKR